MIAAWALALALAPEPAQSLLDRVGAAVANGHHDEALRLTQQDYDERGDHRSLFIMGEIEVDRDRCRDAMEYYERFLATDPATKDRERTQERLAECTAKEADDKPEPPPEPTPQPDRSESVPPPPADVQGKQRPWYADPAGGTLLAGGIVSLAIGAGFYGQAAADRRRANDASTLEDYAKLRERPVLFSKVGIGLLAVGGALTAASIIVYAVRARRGRPRSTALVRF